MAELRIAAIQRDELPPVAALHCRAFPDAALTRFGTEAVRRYYLWLLEGPHDAALIGAWQHEPRSGDVQDDRRERAALALVGFCAAGVFRGAMNGFLRAHRGYLATRIARHPRLLLEPLIRDRIAAALRITLRYSRFARAAPVATPPPARNFGVLAIATDPQVRGAGVGRALMAEAEARARRLGHARMTLTVHPDNARAVQFYEQLGWKRTGEAPWTGSMVRDLR